MTTILVIGAGGREHALAWTLAHSPQVTQIYVAPGNGGTSWPAADGLAPSQNVALAGDDIAGLLEFARLHTIDLTVVGPEAPLVAGIVDAFQASGLAIFGPSQAAAQLEASKDFAKAFMQQHHIPTADYRTFHEYEAARDYLHQLTELPVIKADGLAAGKGVFIPTTRDEADAALQRVMVERAFGAAGNAVVLEERLVGDEISILAFSDGRTIQPILPARDHKRAYDHDKGPNTGGMGAYAPALDITPALIESIQHTVLDPTIAGMAAQGTPYVGVLYAGLMLTADGPKVLEFNCRFGDPETQAVLPLLQTDLVDILQACLAENLHRITLAWQPGACATVVMASPGYPDSYPRGLLITGLDEAESMPEVTVFHAGTAQAVENTLTNGGRVLNVTARGDDLPAALSRAYEAVATIHFDGAHYRRDIGGRQP